VRPAQEVRRLEERDQEFDVLASEAEDLAFHSLDYFSGRPTELRPERRKRLAQRSRIALLEDPLAGAEAQLLADFGFGKGVSIPTARDPKVQDIIDAAWTDANNAEKLTSFQALRKLSNELITAGELFPTLYVNGGRVRVGRLDADLVQNIVPDPEDRLRPLWYVAQVRRYEWDYNEDRPKFTTELKDGRPEVKYWAHWRNLEDAKRERERGDVEADEVPLEEPPEGKIAKGVVYHLAINQTGEQLRGNPPWARSLRFFTAMNLLTEAHVTMAQAASTFIARRAMKGTPRQITKAAASILTSVGELGASARQRYPFDRPESPTQPFTAPGSPAPAPPGSIWNENESSNLEALNLQSGAGQMAQTAQIVRAPIAASSGFGQHYLGDASNANLASASTLELPSTMHIGAWQEGFEGMLRWFTDRSIEAAVKEGLLGGVDGFTGEKPLGEMRLQEAEDRQAMEQRTGLDLSYELTMPFPGRRQLTDVATVVTGMAQSYDPQGLNVPLRKLLLRLFLEQTGVDDVARAVEDCVPESGLPGAGVGFQPQPPAPGGEVQPGSTAAAAGAAAAEPKGEVQQPYGAKSGGTQLQEAAVVAPELAAKLGSLATGSDALFTRMMSEPALNAMVELAAASNGAGSR
jgi:hypothetical protein